MKTWNTYGSEHSASLVMIGRFKDEASAEKAKEVIDEIITFLTQVGDDHLDADRYSESARQILDKVGWHNVAPYELNQFFSDIYPKLNHNFIEISTDEPDISAFLKLMIDYGARVEVYSTHSDPDDSGGNKNS